MCDVDRPVSWVGWPINAFYRWLMGATLVPNMAGDRRGMANRVFSGIAPQLQRAKTLKRTNRGTYRLLKYTVNGTLLLLVALTAWGLLQLFSGALGLG